MGVEAAAAVTAEVVERLQPLPPVRSRVHQVHVAFYVETLSVIKSDLEQELPYGYHILRAAVLAEVDVLEGPDGYSALAKGERRVGEARVVEHGGAEVEGRAETLVRLVGVIEAVDQHLQRVGGTRNA